MTGIQILLFTLILFIGIYFIIRLKRRVFDLVMLSSFVLLAIALVLSPGITNAVARRLNVGRGADLIFYLSIITFWYVSLKLYLRVRNLEKLFTDIVRKQALTDVQELGTYNELTHEERPGKI
jgi:hypothetical protein